MMNGEWVAIVLGVLSLDVMIVLSLLAALLFVYRAARCPELHSPAVAQVIHALWWLNFGGFYLALRVGLSGQLDPESLVWFRVSYAGMAGSTILINGWVIWNHHKMY